MKTLFLILFFLLFCLVFCESKEKIPRQIKLHEAIYDELEDEPSEPFNIGSTSFHVDSKKNSFQLNNRNVQGTPQMKNAHKVPKHYNNPGANTPGFANTLIIETFCNSSNVYSLCSGASPFYFLNDNREAYSSQVIYNPSNNQFFAVFLDDFSVLGQLSVLGVILDSNGNLISLISLFSAQLFSGPKGNPKVIVNQKNNQYLVGFEFGTFDSKYSASLILGFVSFNGTLLGYQQIAAGPNSGFAGLSMAFDPFQDVYIVTVGTETANPGGNLYDIGIFIFDPIGMNLTGEGVFYNSGYADSNPTVAVSGDGSSYFFIFQIDTSVSYDLLALTYTTATQNFTIMTYISWVLQTDSGIYQVFSKYPQLMFVPNLNNFLLTAEINVPQLNLTEIAIALFNSDTTYTQKMTQLTTSYFGFTHVDATVTLLSGPLAAAIFEEESATTSAIAFLSFDLLSGFISTETILSNPSLNSYLPTVAYNSQNQIILTMWESDINTQVSSMNASSSHRLSGGAIAGIVIGVIVGVLLIALFAVGLFKYFSRRNNVRRTSGARLVDEEFK